MALVGDMTQFGSMMAGVMFVWAIFKQWFPQELRDLVENYFRRLASYFYPYITIHFPEYQSDEFERSQAYVAIDRYLGTNSSNKAKRLKANVFRNCKTVILGLADYEEVTDDFQGIKIWWSSGKNSNEQQVRFSSYGENNERRYYKLTCHRKNREIITNVYLHHVLDQGMGTVMKNRQRKLYTNGKWNWSHIIFEHPSTFDTLAMHPEKKRDILNDLRTFIKSEEYYKSVGKSWKRGYLLYGPPGTGKSSMIAAMANFLDYDIYDLELTSVTDNTDLRRLLINTTSKSIIVIEDIDCSLDLTGQRKEKKGEDEGKEKKNLDQKIKEEDKKKKGSEVTLSGLLNFIDGLWSACGSERLIVFTTNFVEKLDPALIRRGRMDKHIELSYCCFETFKVLAKNYLRLPSHELFPSIGRLLEEINITPADVAENLMPKSPEENAETCLLDLIKVLNKAKEEARLKGVDDAEIS